MTRISGITGSGLVKAPQAREQLIDLLRGIAILDMMLVHFSIYFPKFVEKLICYTDFAMEGFLFLSGFSIGYHYFPKYIHNRRSATRRLILKAVNVYKVQLLLILTINLPLYYVLYDKIRETESIWVFLAWSALLLNQIGLIHILPTFIPLFLMSPFVLYCVERGKGGWCLVGSILLFLLGNEYPYFVSIGDNPIFPVILWQIYFIIGCLIGKEAWARKKAAPASLISRYLALSVLLFCTAMFIQHAKVVPPSLTSRFPLNILGLLYGASILFLVYLLAAKYLNQLQKARLFRDHIPTFGRHSLMAFVIHVYTAKMLAVGNYLWDLSRMANYLCIFISILMIYGVLRFYEDKDRGRVASPILKRTW